jgi:hypothetical protein
MQVLGLEGREVEIVLFGDLAIRIKEGGYVVDGSRLRQGEYMSGFCACTSIAYLKKAAC